MNIQLSVHGPNSTAEFRSLHQWLRGKSNELRTSGVTMEHTDGVPGRPDAMGAVFEIVQFAFDNVAQYGALALAIASWRRAYPARSTFTFERDGVKITLTEAEISDLPTLLRALEELGEGDGPEELDDGEGSEDEE